MTFTSWADEKTKKIDFIDIQFIKLAVFLFALPIGAYFSSKILPYWWIFIILAILVAIKPWSKVFKG